MRLRNIVTTVSTHHHHRPRCCRDAPIPATTEHIKPFGRVIRRLSCPLSRLLWSPLGLLYIKTPRPAPSFCHFPSPQPTKVASLQKKNFAIISRNPGASAIFLHVEIIVLIRRAVICDRCATSTPLNNIKSASSSSRLHIRCCARTCNRNRQSQE